MTAKKASTAIAVRPPSLMDYAIQRDSVIRKIIENGGEITPEDDLALVDADANLENKVSGYLAVMDYLEALEGYAKEQAAIASGYAKSCGNMVKGLRGRLLAGLQMAGVEKIKAGFRTVSLQKFAEEVDVFDEEKIPENMADIEFKPIIKARKLEIKIALQAGKEVPGARLITKPDGIRITSRAERKTQEVSAEAPAGELPATEAA